MEVKYKAGYAKSGRSSCKLCKGALPLHKLRLGKNTPSTFFDGYQLVWYHPTCLIKRDKNNIKSSDNIEGFEHLKFEDQQKVRSLLGEQPGVQDEQAVANHKKFWEVREKVNNFSLQELKSLLEHNGCPTTGGQLRLVFKVTDGIVYGVPTCPSCDKVGEMNFNKGVYTCAALLDWGKCGHEGEPKSITPFKFPSGIDIPPVLRKYSSPLKREAGGKSGGGENGDDGEDDEGDDNEDDDDDEEEDDDDGSGSGSEDEDDYDEDEDEEDEERSTPKKSPRTPIKSPKKSDIPKKGASAFFGTSSGFGAPASTAGFGSTSGFGVAASTGGFGSTSGFGSNSGFGSTTKGTSGFGGGGFGSSSPSKGLGFGSSSGFGAPAASTASFGSTSAFGSTSMFGAPAAPTSSFGKSPSGFGSFGSTSATGGFGATTGFGSKSGFGSSSTPATGFGSTSGFGAQASTGGFGSTSGASEALPAFASVFGSQPATKAHPASSLSGLIFSHAGRLSMPKRRLTTLLNTHGGRHYIAINSSVNYVVTTAAEIARGRARIRKCQQFGLQFVTELFVHRLIACGGEPVDVTPYLLQYNADIPSGQVIKPVRKSKIEKPPKPIKIGKPPKKAAALKAARTMAKPMKMPKMKKMPKAPKMTTKAPARVKSTAMKSTGGKAPRKSSFFAPSSPKKAAAPATFSFGSTAPVAAPIAQTGSKFGGAVDPGAKCPGGSIFVDGNDVYNVMLNQTDIAAGTNKYFKLQLIDVSGTQSRFVFYAKWGRVGTDIGMDMRKDVSGTKAAIALFAEKYMDKTGNNWSQRANFAKKPGKYFPVELDEQQAPPSAGFGAAKPSQASGAPAAGVAPVDALSGKAGEAHVLVENGVIYDVMLNQTNIGSNNNKFYVIQVLERNDGNAWWVWNRWGRVGEKGQSKLSQLAKAGAINDFKKKFTEKTKNSWENRANFQAVAGKYTLLEMDYGQDAPALPAAVDGGSSVKSALHPSVQDLVNLIFDVRMMNQTLTDLNIDVKKMPLGKISKQQILRGYEILTKIDSALKNKGNKSEYMMLSNQFYTIIPHDFGRKVPEIIDNVDLLKLKMKQMETLIEIQVASDLIQQAAAAGIHPTDAKYNKLGTKIEVMDSSHPDFHMISKYLKNSYEPADSPYTLELENVFVIEREGEDSRFENFASLHRELLWHGSRLSNWVGIISQGLRIAPPEAPKTGYMFGKGVYFGDMVAKSAEYCFTTPTSNTGLLLLSKVALGNRYEVTQPEYMEKAPDTYHSCHALAKLKPDPSDYGTMTDFVTKVPYGRGVESYVPDAFLSHGEYVVYNVGQINMKYLLRVKFHHK